MAEQFTNAAQTTLAAPLSAGATSLTVTSAAAFPAAGTFRVLIGGELLTVTAVSGANWTVTRAAEVYAGAQAAAAHAAGAQVTHVLTAAALAAATGHSTAGGADNECYGSGAGAALTTGHGNTMVGSGAGNLTAGGSNNVCVGSGAVAAGGGSSQCIAIGPGMVADTTCIAIGTGTTTTVTGAFAIAIGTNDSSTGSNTIIIGADSSIGGAVTHGIAIGDANSITADESIAIGVNATVASPGHACMIGTDAGFVTANTEGEFRWCSNGPSFVARVRVTAQTSASSDRPQFVLDGSWVSSTDASRKARLVISAYDAAAREAFRCEGSGTVAMISFFGAVAVIQQAGTGTTAGFTAGTGTAVRDDSTFTGNVGSTAYRISDVVKALKNYGLLAQ